MDTPESADTPSPSQPPSFLVPLPNLAPKRPYRPNDESPNQPPQPSPETPETSPHPSDLDDEPSEYDEPDSPRTTTSTRRKSGGDPRQVAQVIGGLLVLLTATLALLANQRGRTFRQPTVRERDDIAQPLARIAVRHLPLDALGPDLADATMAAVALHGYVMAGPLTPPISADSPAGDFNNLHQE
jgi:hypothetical protein